MASPVSLVDFYNCELDHNGLFTCDFSGGSVSPNTKTASGAARDNYFSSPDGNLATKVCYMTDCTFIRKDMTLTVNRNADYLNDKGVNYCRFENPAGAGNNSEQVRWYYCFINKIEYVAPETSRCYLQTDVFTTYFDVINLNQCMVEREHVYNDTVYTHTLSEPTPTIEYEHNDIVNKTWDFDDFIATFAVTGDPDETGADPPIYRYHNVGYMRTPGQAFATNNIGRFMKLVIEDGRQVIWSAWVPEDMCALDQEVSPDIYELYEKSEAGGWQDIDLNGIGHANGYITYGEGAGAVTHWIRNNKINCYPYCMYRLTDNWAQNIVLKPEDLGSDKIHISSNLGASPCISIYPDYKVGVNTEQALNITDFQAVPFEVNYYNQFVALNKNQLNVAQTKDDWTVAKSIMNIPTAVAKGATGDIAGGVDSVMGGLFEHFDREAMLSDMKRRPSLFSNPPAGSVKIGNGTFGFSVVEEVPKLEYIEILDNFFDRYGYNVSQVKIPAWNTRAYWNYIKTNGACMSGRVPVDDLKKLNALFDAGITIFHTAANYGQYTGLASSNRAPVH